MPTERTKIHSLDEYIAKFFEDGQKEKEVEIHLFEDVDDSGMVIDRAFIVIFQDGVYYTGAVRLKSQGEEPQKFKNRLRLTWKGQPQKVALRVRAKEGEIKVITPNLSSTKK